MIRKLLCWLGWHEYKWGCKVPIQYMRCIPDCVFCKHNKLICKHCGKVKR